MELCQSRSNLYIELFIDFSDKIKSKWNWKLTFQEEQANLRMSGVFDLAGFIGMLSSSGTKS